ncbi:Protein adenylyltransferase [Flavobacterium longum]|uniref:Fic family protein n=1 Tax=Flavobacterium longum TaxID=1299340 RepID=UPI0039E82318
MSYEIPLLPLAVDVETRKVLRQLNAANRKLAELKGIALTIPNETILINTLVLQEAKDSSAVENIVTTHDDLYKADAQMKEFAISASTKEVLSYAEAVKLGFQIIRKDKLLLNSCIKEIQKKLEQNSAGFRSVPGTTLKNQVGQIVYTPPQEKNAIERYMDNLQTFINDDSVSDLDPLIKMAIIHHQFESIHPFYDGNGRTGRIINILYLISKNLLDLPILYLSRYVINNKAEYYQRIQAVRDDNEWEAWILYMLKGVEQTAEQTIAQVKAISTLMMQYKHKIRPLLGRSYRHEFLNNLFSHPYTKIDFVCKTLGVGRITATKYLNKLVEHKLLEKVKVGRTNYYMNMQLCNLLMNSVPQNNHKNDQQIESVHE